jgi:hypothetical protein
VSQPTLSNAGRTGFYDSDKFIYSTRDYEALWIEIKRDLKGNI